MTFVLTGLDIEAKAAWADAAAVRAARRPRAASTRSTCGCSASTDPTRRPTSRPPRTCAITVKDAATRSGSAGAFSDATIELALGRLRRLPHHHAADRRQARTASTGRRWCRPTSSTHASSTPTGNHASIAHPPSVAGAIAPVTGPPDRVGRWRPDRPRTARTDRRRALRRQGRQRQRRHLGRDHAAYAWLRATSTSEPRSASCSPRPPGSRSDRFELPNLRALNFVIVGLLGDGVAASTRPDPQAKGLGEYLRSRFVELPAHLLAGS